jgi:predicted ATPase
LGYDVIPLPLTGIAQRADFVLASLDVPVGLDR